MTPPCGICIGIAGTAPERVVFRAGGWIAYALDVPGWTMVATTRHSDWSWDLTDGEEAGLGTALARVTMAVRTACNAERTYVMGLGENYSHFHYIVIPRYPDDSDRVISAAVHSAMTEVHAALTDSEEADRVAQSVREAIG